MMDELRITILNRVINELFQEADHLIKEGIKLTEKNKKIVTLGLSLSVAGLMHSFLSPVAAIALDVVNVFVMGGVFAGNNLESIKNEVEKIKQFTEHFSIEKEDIVYKIKTEFTSDLRIGTYFTQNQVNKIIDNGILNLRKEEIEMFSQIRFNDDQEEYLKDLINKKEKINVINFLDLSLLEGSSQNKKYVNLGGKNKTLKEIMEPAKKYRLMK